MWHRRMKYCFTKLSHCRKSPRWKILTFQFCVPFISLSMHIFLYQHIINQSSVCTRVSSYFILLFIICFFTDSPLLLCFIIIMFFFFYIYILQNLGNLFCTFANPPPQQLLINIQNGTSNTNRSFMWPNQTSRSKSRTSRSTRCW